MGARAQLGWMIRGGASTRAALDSLSNDLRELQQKVVGLETALHEAQRNQVRLGERQLDEFDSIRTAIASATDDLVDRVNAIDGRVSATT